MLTFLLVEIYVVTACVLVLAWVKISRAYRKYRFKDDSEEINYDDLPSVSICMPARNETNAMTECLESVLALKYPKLEVIVLDDNSSDNTSHLIKAFAHAGVRFIKGKALPSDWLGKNYALETLLAEASGKYIMFMDVDTRLKPDSVKKLIQKMTTDESKMISVIPQMDIAYKTSVWFSSMRYLWELVLDTKDSPGSSSAAWMIDRRLLRDELGGFGLWRDEVQPESQIAGEMRLSKEYSLVISTASLGVYYAKKWSSQIETGRRLLLPRFNNSFTSMLVGISLLFAVVLPQIIVVIALIRGNLFLAGIELILGLAATLLFAAYSRLVWSGGWLVAALVAPYVAWQEIVLLISSGIGYYKGSITWKGRTVLRPARRKTTAP